MKSTGTFTLGTLDGRLNRAQTRLVDERLRRFHPKAVFDMATVADPESHRASRDKYYSTHSPAEVEFLQRQLLDGAFQLVDICAEDLSLPLPEGLVLAAVLERDTPYDALLHRDALIADDLEPGTRVGVLSRRSHAQISALWPALKPVLMSGGVVAAVEAFLQRGTCNCLVIPAAQGERLGVQDVMSEIFFPEMMLPGAGQGLIALLARENDTEVLAMAAEADSAQSHQELTAELTFRERIRTDQDCALGVLAQANDGQLIITGAIGSLTGSAPNQAVLRGPADEAAALGKRLAEELLSQPAALIDLLEGDFPEGIPADADDDLPPEDDPDLEAEIEALPEEDLDDFAPPREDC